MCVCVCANAGKSARLLGGFSRLILFALCDAWFSPLCSDLPSTIHTLMTHMGWSIEDIRRATERDTKLKPNWIEMIIRAFNFCYYYISPLSRMSFICYYSYLSLSLPFSRSLHRLWVCRFPSFSLFYAAATADASACVASELLLLTVW